MLQFSLTAAVPTPASASSARVLPAHASPSKTLRRPCFSCSRSEAGSAPLSPHDAGGRRRETRAQRILRRLRAAGEDAGPRRGRRASSMTSEGDPWRMLGIERGVSPDEVRDAFRKQIRAGAHPDLGGDPERFRLLRVAYQNALHVAENPAAAAQYVDSVESAAEEEEEPEKTMDDFWRQREDDEQHARAVQEARQEQLERQRAKARRRAASAQTVREATVHDDAWADKRIRRVMKALQDAPTPELRAAWQRELRGEKMMHDLAERSEEKDLQDKAVEAKAAAPRGKPKAAKDVLVGHRTVRARQGEVRVPVYEADTGKRYYVSPLTSRRIPVPR
eukprot:TRINITY_DN45420_c0_g1_i1.p1 TRINITY_DN45420_c0_g1~~TRINITY_DN45420_c0_g1_i1.p1  ORF type:complete len:335 (-),score=73.35 TRINITY_DN45420_c0_g1_i1:3-1007(-)